MSLERLVCINTRGKAKSGVYVRVCILLSHGGDHQVLLVQDGRGILVAPYFKHCFFLVVETGGHKKCLVLHNVRL